jgi:hypothetical protein
MLSVFQKRGRLVCLLVGVLFFITVFLLVFSLSMQKGLAHDEDQFIASGAILANKLILPYKDYPYFHMPNLVFVYGMLFKYSDYMVFSARLLSVVCAFLSLGLIFYIAWNVFDRHRYMVRLMIAGGGVILFLTNPLFTVTTGWAWNHDLPVLLALLAFVFHCRGVMEGNTKTWTFLSGILLGLAMGTRLSFAPLVLPFLGIMFLYPNLRMWKTSTGLALAFCTGLVLSLLPSLVLFSLFPEQFVFGNIGYAQLNTIYRQEAGFERAMTLFGKTKYVIKDVIGYPGNLLLTVAFMVFVPGAGRISLRGNRRHDLEMVFILLLIPFLLIGAFVPTPSWYQYFYAPVPFVVLGILYAIGSFEDDVHKLKWSLNVFGVLVILSSIYGLPEYHHIRKVLSPEAWFPSKAHAVGMEIKAAVGEGSVLTLAPLLPVEGKVDIYEEFTTGPFAWRTARFVPQDKRRVFKVVSERDLRDFLRTRPPRGILVGFEEAELEKSLVDYATEHGYESLKLSNGKTLWLSGVPTVAEVKAVQTRSSAGENGEAKGAYGGSGHSSPVSGRPNH